MGSERSNHRSRHRVTALRNLFSWNRRSSIAPDKPDDMLPDSLQAAEIEPQLLEPLPRWRSILESRENGLGKTFRGQLIRVEHSDKAETFH
jgi:hypothetical protein